MRAFAGLLVLLTACGGAATTDDGGGETSTAPPTTSPPATTATSSMPDDTAPPSTPQEPLGPLDGAIGDWVLIMGQVGDALILPNEDAPITLTIDANQITGNAGCNSYFADRLPGDVPIGPVGSTLMACTPDIMAAEMAYLTGLAQARETAVEGTQLVFVGDELELRFDPGQELASGVEFTDWVLDTYSTGDVGTFSEAPATLRLAGGRIEGSTGCNTFSGSYLLDAEKLDVADLAVTEIGCEQVIMAQESAVLAVLAGSSTASLAGNRLFISNGERTLTYRPAA